MFAVLAGWLVVVGWVACVVEWLYGWKPNAGRSSNSGAACWVRHTAHSRLANMEKCSHSRVSHCGPAHIAHCWVGRTAQGEAPELNCVHSKRKPLSTLDSRSCEMLYKKSHCASEEKRALKTRDN